MSYGMQAKERQSEVVFAKEHDAPRSVDSHHEQSKSDCRLLEFAPFSDAKHSVQNDEADGVIDAADDEPSP